MVGITAADIKKELKRIAFFVQHSGLFDNFSSTTRRTLESLPVEWESVQVDGETQLKWQEEPTWSEADLEGKLNDKPLKMNIRKSSSRNIYTITYEGKRYVVENMPALKDLFTALESGDSPKPQVMQDAYDTLSKKKMYINTQSKQHKLNNVYKGNWSMDINKDSSRIFVKFSTPIPDEADKATAEEKLLEDEKAIINTIGSFVKKTLEKEGVEVKNLVFTQRLLNAPGKAGFLITIK